MLKIIGALFVLLSSNLNAVSQNNRFKTIEISNQVQVRVPAGFREPVLIKSVSDSLPKKWVMCYQNARFIYRELVNVGGEKEIFSDNDVPEWTDKILNDNKEHPLFSYIDDGIFLQNGKNIGYIKYSEVLANEDVDNYHLIFFMSVNGKFAQFDFFCPSKSRKKWEPIADAIANSLRVKAE